jgi:hypothetical protein
VFKHQTRLLTARHISFFLPSIPERGVLISIASLLSEKQNPMGKGKNQGTVGGKIVSLSIGAHALDGTKPSPSGGDEMKCPEKPRP